MVATPSPSSFTLPQLLPLRPARAGSQPATQNKTELNRLKRTEELNNCKAVKLNNFRKGKLKTQNHSVKIARHQRALPTEHHPSPPPKATSSKQFHRASPVELVLKTPTLMQICESCPSFEQPCSIDRVSFQRECSLPDWFVALFFVLSGPFLLPLAMSATNCASWEQQRPAPAVNSLTGR